MQTTASLYFKTETKRFMELYS